MDRLSLVAGDAQVARRPSATRRSTGSRRCRAAAETAPSCIAEPRVSERSSQCSESTRPVIEAYWSARRRRPALSTGRPSSEKPTAPASASAPSSASCSPRWPSEIAPRKPTATAASLAARSCSACMSERGVDHRIGVRHREDRGEAAGGGRGGARSRCPPRAPGPGVRRCTCGSMKAGQQREAVGLDELGVVGRRERVAERRRSYRRARARR